MITGSKWEQTIPFIVESIGAEWVSDFDNYFWCANHQTLLKNKYRVEVFTKTEYYRSSISSVFNAVHRSCCSFSLYLSFRAIFIFFKFAQPSDLSSVKTTSC